MDYVEFSDVAVLKIAVEEGGGWVGWVGGEMGGFETGTDEELGAGGEGAC